MQVLIATEFRVGKYNNQLYLASQAYTIFKRYADAFGPVSLLARVEELSEIPIGYKQAQYVDKIIEVKSLINELTGIGSVSHEIEKVDLIIGRLPSVIAYRAYYYAKENQIPYLAELMCDGWDSYWSHSFQGKLIAPYMDAKMRSVTKNANYAIYVTENYLQKKYPCNCPNINASNVVISATDDKILERRYAVVEKFNPENISLMTTADVDNKSKGHEFVIKAIKILREKGINATYYMAGGGSQEYLKRIAQKNGVLENVVFLGRLTMDRVFQEIDKVDIYIQPSLQEGLPRAVIEAMSRGCFCIGANTAGMPELVSSDFIVKRKNAQDIADKIVRYSEIDSISRKKIAKNCYTRSQDYLAEVLDKRRNIFFAKIIHDCESKG